MILKVEGIVQIKVKVEIEIEGKLLWIKNNMNTENVVTSKVGPSNHI